LPAPLPLGEEAGSTEPSIVSFARAIVIFAPLPPSPRPLKKKWEKRKRPQEKSCRSLSQRN
jgi:hypothetical protein